MQSKDWLRRLADVMELEGEAIPLIPIVEIGGDSRVLIERHCGILEYSRERIGVKVRYGTICVLGYGLEITRMTRQQLVISGRIDGVQLHRRCR